MTLTPEDHSVEALFAFSSPPTYSGTPLCSLQKAVDSLNYAYELVQLEHFHAHFVLRHLAEKFHIHDSSYENQLDLWMRGWQCSPFRRYFRELTVPLLQFYSKTQTFHQLEITDTDQVTLGDLRWLNSISRSRTPFAKYH